MNKLNVYFLGQVFTEKNIVKKMLLLRKNIGLSLEPSCGDGAFFNAIENCVGIEFDKFVCPLNAINMDFFDYNISNKFKTIIGNPPYVKYQKINLQTKEKLNINFLDERANLYLFFIDKCLDHLEDGGELIFITPRDFIKASSAINLNKKIYKLGTITDWIDLGDEIVFPGFAPNCAIFRFVKGDFTRITNNNLSFVESAGQLFFTKDKYTKKFSDYFFVKVGAVSGADKLFENKNGNVEFVNSKTIDTNKAKKMYFNVNNDELLIHKNILLKRKIKKFNENNWYEWGRGYFKSDLPRVYVNAKTRRTKPFFLHDENAYDGSILAIFPKFNISSKEELKKICEYLNKINWDDLGFVCGGRYLFNQKSLENTIIPDDHLLNILDK
jgi:adenine-specific DNA-methyltransferase